MWRMCIFAARLHFLTVELGIEMLRVIFCFMHIFVCTVTLLV